MKTDLSTFPTDPKYPHANEYIMRILEWKENFTKKFEELNAEEWFNDNVYEDWDWEGMLKKFIDKEILGQ